jgi:hypothetical protein
MPNQKIPTVPSSVHGNFIAVITVVKRFCDDKLNQEYSDLALKLAVKIARKRPSPLLSGRANTWGAGIIHALGKINFLFDKSQTPHIQSADIADWFDLSSSTISAKSKSIIDMLKMYHSDFHWILPSTMDNDPMIWMVMIDGYIVDIRQMSYAIQVEALEAGVIPYIPVKITPHS